MKEYGGYIEFEYFHGREYHEGAYRFQTARHALRYILREKGIREIYLPEYLCPVIVEACKQEGVCVRYYPVGRDLSIYDDRVPEDAWIYVINYYGQLGNEEIKTFHKRHPHMLVDNVQAFFQKPVEDIDTIYTCRKFFGVPDGAYLYTDVSTESYDNLCRDDSMQRLKYLVGRMEFDATTFYGEFSRVSEEFSNEPIRRMSIFTENMMRGIDYDAVLNKRTENFQFLHSHLAKYNKFSLKYFVGGYMYPLHVSNGEDIRKKLVKQKIYVPVLWPGLGKSEDDEVYRLAHEIVPLPIDQRYDILDMEFLVRRVKQCITCGN